MKFCKECGIEINLKETAKFCSRYCLNKNYYKQKSIKLHEENKKLICIECGKTHSKKRKTRYCGKKCQFAHFYKLNKEKLLKDALKRVRDKVRKKRGLPLDHPPLIGKAGSGSICKKTGYKYFCIPSHPNAHKNGKISEHTMVMSKYLSRPLSKGESVHHKNGDKLDNRIENLELWHKGQPAGQRVQDKIDWCKEFLAQYGYKTIMDLKE